MVVVGEPGGRQPAQQALGGGERLGCLTRRHRLRVRDCREPVGVQGAHRLVGEQEAAPVDRPERAVEHVADVDRVVRAARDRPQRLHARRDALQRARGAADRLGPAVEQDRVGQRLIHRRALGVQRGEALAVARQRPALAARAAPGGRLVDVEHHHGVAGQQIADARGADRPAADRDHRRRAAPPAPRRPGPPRLRGTRARRGRRSSPRSRCRGGARAHGRCRPRGRPGRRPRRGRRWSSRRP